MARQGYTHKLINLECTIESTEIKKKTQTIRLPSKDNWQKNLKSLISRVPKKFSFISQMDDSEWILTINGQLIDKNDSEIFVELLSKIEPIAVVKIEKTKKEDNWIISVHFNDKQFDYKIKSNTEEWENDDYIHLIEVIRKEFNLVGSFGLYEDIQGQHINVNNMDDIEAAFQNDDNDDDDDDDDNDNDDDEKKNDQELNAAKTINLFIKVQNQLKIICGSQYFMWIPPNKNSDDEDEWNDNYNDLVNKINEKYNIDKDKISLEQMEDDVTIDIGCGDDLMATWDTLIDDESNDIAEIKIVGDFIHELSTNIGEENKEENKGEEQPQIQSKEIDKSPVNNVADEKETLLLSAEKQEMEKWFDDKVGLPQYFTLFLKHKYENLTYFDENVIEDDLVKLGIVKRPHRNKILKEIQ
eukprot:112326_1